MMDWANSIECRNYRIGRQLDWTHLFDLLKFTVSVTLLAGVFGFHAWVRCEAVDMGYEEQNLAKQESVMLTEQNYLILEEESLKNPGRIEAIAQNDLGMIRVHANQLVTPVQMDIETTGSETMAMLSDAPVNSDPRRPSVTN
jgi:cell division protein FtsL